METPARLYVAAGKSMKASIFTFTDGHMFSTRVDLRDNITVPLVMQMWFGKWAQVMVSSLVWCVFSNLLGTHRSYDTNIALYIC